MRGGLNQLLQLISISYSQDSINWCLEPEVELRETKKAAPAFLEIGDG